MDRAYEDDQTRQLALEFGWIPVVPPKRNRLEPWEYGRVLYRRRNEVERLTALLDGRLDTDQSTGSIKSTFCPRWLGRERGPALRSRRPESR